MTEGTGRSEGMAQEETAVTEPSARFAELDALSTEELRQLAFGAARERHDLSFFWSVLQHLPHADDAEALDTSMGAYAASIDDAVALWRELTGHGYAEAEPLLRAAFIDYLMKHPA